ncbi:response regulator [Afipia carboxidovorans]|uniref:response regulator n=1 Tax=Afipia carboxidovorans TaxID=40137 RepID=UPI003086EFAA|nr:hypothetical protein CRBSH125_26940 [Afipia carboxidovorans]
MDEAIFPVHGEKQRARRVLIVDDDADVAGSLASLLQLEHYDVEIAHGPETALPLGAGADVALVDIRLGHADGVQLAAELRQHHPDILVVMMTAYASIQTAIKAIRAGAYDYLCKPFDPDDLLATLDRCFERLDLVRSRREAEEQLRHSRRMEALGQLTAGVAHDFNNLLSVVIGNLRLAREDVSASSIADTAVLRELVQDALDAALGGVETTRRFLALGRNQALTPETLDLRIQVSELSRSLERMLGEEVGLVVNVPETACVIYADRHQFDASLLNLAINARDAVAEREDAAGRIVLDVACIDLRDGSPRLLPDMKPGSYVRISVTDNGCGMTAEIREKALQPFFTTKAAERGSGLGLSTVYSFVRQSEGNLAIDSMPGVGTTVSLYLPLCASDRRAEQAARSEIADNGRVLLVEDQAPVRALFTRQLNRLGYEVTAAGNAEDALRILESGRAFDLMLSDVMLPNRINGTDLCRIVRQRWPRTAILLATALPAAALETLCEEGSDARVPILQKPVEIEVLAVALRRALAQCDDSGESVKT